MALEIQLDVYIMDMGFDNNFLGLTVINELARKMETEKNKLYSLIFLLVTLALILPLLQL